MAFIKNRNGDNVYYRNDHDRDNRYFSCRDGNYAGRREHNNTYTDRNGNPHYKKY